MPYVFAGSAASAAGGLGLLAVHPADAEPARDLAVLGATVELIAKRQLLARLARPGEQSLAEPYETGTTARSSAWPSSSPRARWPARYSAGQAGPSPRCLVRALVAASAMTRFGIFEAGPGLGPGSQVHRSSRSAAAVTGRGMN